MATGCPEARTTIRSSGGASSTQRSSRSALTIRGSRSGTGDPDVRDFLYWSRMPQVIQVDGRRLPQRPAFSGASPASTFLVRSTSGSRIHNSPVMSTRGEHLVHADRRFATGGGLLARLTGARPSRRCSTRSTGDWLAAGSSRLPDGQHAASVPRHGPESGRAAVELAGAGPPGDLRFGRLVQGRALGEWSSPDPVRCSKCSRANADAARRHRPRERAVPLA